MCNHANRLRYSQATKLVRQFQPRWLHREGYVLKTSREITNQSDIFVEMKERTLLESRDFEIPCIHGFATLSYISELGKCPGSSINGTINAEDDTATSDQIIQEVRHLLSSVGVA